MKNQMMKIAGVLAVSSMCWLCSGCSDGVKDTEVSRESVGLVVDVEYIQATWSQSPATVIRTETGAFFIYGHFYVPLGQEAFKTLWSNDKHYLYWEGSDTHYYINK